MSRIELLKKIVLLCSFIFLCLPAHSFGVDPFIIENVEIKENREKFNAIVQHYEKELKDHPQNGKLVLALAEVYYSLREYKKAIIYYQRALKLDQQNTSIKTALAQSYLNNHDLKQSNDLFQQVIQKEPNNLLAMSGLGRIAALQNHYHDAEELYQKVLKVSPDDINTLYYLGELRIAQKQYAEAEKISQKLVKRQPKAAWIVRSLHKAQLGPLTEKIKKLEKEGKIQEAFSIYKKYLENNPYSIDIYLLLSSLYLKEDNTLKAIETLKEGLALYPEDHGLLVSLGFVYLANNETRRAATIFEEQADYNDVRSEAIAGLGRIAVLENNTEKAEKLYQLSITLNPLNTTPLFYLAQLRLDQKRFEEAVQILEKIIKIDPEQIDVVPPLIEEAESAPMMEAAAEEENKHHYKEAEQEYKKIIGKFPKRVSPYIRLGRLYILQKEYQKAIQNDLLGLNTNPQSSDLQVAIGFAYLWNKEFDKAEQVLNEVLYRDPSNRDALLGIGQLNRLTGNKEAAVIIYEKVLLDDPYNETALSFLADLRNENHEYQEAQRLFARILEVDPKAEWAQQALLRAQYGDLFDEIHTLQLTKSYDEAIRNAQELVEQAPKSIEAYLVLGHLYTITKQDKRLLNLYQEGVAYHPQSDQLRVNLGLAYLRSNQIEEAKRAFEFVLKRDPINTEAIAGLGRVAALTDNPSLAEKRYDEALQLNPENLLALSYLGDFFLKKEEYSKAEQIYKKILTLSPNASWPKIALENAKYAPLLKTIGEKEGTKEFDKAEKLYLQLIDDSSHNISFYIKLGQLYIKINQPRKAIKLYKQGLKAHPQSIDLQVALGFAYLESGELRKGEDLFTLILKRNAKEATAIAGLGRLAELKGNLAKAKQLYKQSIQINPDNITALIYLAGLLYKEGNYASAKRDFKKILSLDPTALWVKQSIKDAQHGKLLKEIKNREEAKDLIGAEILWEQLLLEESNESDYYLRAGLFYHKVKQYQKAINTYHRGLIVSKNSSELYAALGLTYLSQKKWAEARKAFNRSLKRDPKNPDALAGLGDIALVNKNFPKARDLVQKALAIDPQRIAALSVLGDLYMKERKYEDAEKIYEKLHKLRPEEKWILLEFDDAKNGVILDQIKELIENEEFSEAAQNYVSLLEESPDNPNYYFGLGQMYMRLKKYGLSIQINLEGLEKNPDVNALRVALGYAYFYGDQLEEARQTLTKAIEIDSKNPEALAGLGRVNALEENYCAAESAYREALSIDPKNLSALSFLGDLLMKEKRYSEAQEIFSTLWQILPDAEWVKHSWRDARDAPIRDIAQRYADREYFELAAGLYEQLVESAPDSPDRYLPLGQMYVNMQCYCKGIQIYREGLSLDPEAWYLWREIAFAYILVEDYCSSQNIFISLLDQNPEDAESWAGLGRIKALTGDRCAAEQYYFTALAIACDNLIALSFLADLREAEGYHFSALENYEQIVAKATNGLGEKPKWVRKGFNKALNLTQPTLQVLGSYHEEDQWAPGIDRWSAEYLVYGATALLNYPFNDKLTLWGSCTDKFYLLKDLLLHDTIYSFDVQKIRVGAKWAFRSYWSLEAITGFTNFSPYRYGSFEMLHGTIAEPSIILSYDGSIQKGVLSFTTDSDLVARDFNSNKAKIVGYYQINGAYSRRMFTRGWLGIECNTCWYRDFVNNNSQKALGWLNWRPPIYSDNINFRYFVKYQTFSKNIPDYYTYKPQIINQLQLTLEKSWRVCWADTLYTSLMYGHGWQNTRTRFRQVIVVDPIATPLPIGWDNRQYNMVLGNMIYKYGRLQSTLVADYYRDTQKYTIWTIAGDLTWRF